jgi:hypothetical protein
VFFQATQKRGKTRPSTERHHAQAPGWHRFYTSRFHETLK